MTGEPFLLDEDALTALAATSCGTFRTGERGVRRVLTTGDRKVEFVRFDSGKVLAHVKSAMGYPAYYPLEPATIERPLRAVLMDLDGTSVRSESFWVWIIERTTARLLGDERFGLEDADLPFVSGHSVSEHLRYCIDKYVPGASLEQARKFYFEITYAEMRAVLEGRGRADAFQPSPGLKDFLIELKRRGIKIGLVTSGLYEKAWPEIVAAFRQLGLGDPCAFYDAIISAGFPLRKGEVGTLGELEPKPHPWLYAETARVGLGVDFADRARVIGIEDSGAGVVAIRLAGFAAIGMEGGNIRESGTAALCSRVCRNFEEVLRTIEG
jgi:beta-phosphoglucomutase-like phosphatase (HAD superfamily)